jgi:hypothetical protein
LRILSKSEVEELVKKGKKLSAKEGTAILDEFEKSQPQMYQAIFGELSDAVAEENLDMANLFLDLCFDIIFVYNQAFGSAPVQSNEKDWLSARVALLDAELKSLNNDASMSSKFKQRLRNRFVERSIDTGVQIDLLKHLDEQVKSYASFQSSRKKAIHVTNNFLFVVVRLMDDVYSSA